MGKKKRSKKQKNIKKKAAQQRAAEKRSSAHKKKKAEVATSVLEEKKEATKKESAVAAATTAATATVTESATEILEKGSTFFLETHRDATLILVTVIACAILFVTWQRAAEKKWQAQAWKTVQQEVDELKLFGKTFSEKEKTLLSLLEKYKDSPLEPYLKAKLAHLYYYYRPNPDEQEKLSFEEVKRRLEKAKELYGELRKEEVPEGIRIVAQKNYRAVEEQIRYLESPPQPKIFGVLKQDS